MIVFYIFIINITVMIKFISWMLLSVCVACIVGCATNTKVHEYPKAIGEVQILDDDAYGILSDESTLEIIDSGYIWTEGPLWLDEQSSLLFSDVAQNKIYQWKDGRSSTVYLENAGLADSIEYVGKEPGSNGLLLNMDGQLIIAQHGNRQIAMMEAPVDTPVPKFKSLVNTYDGKRLNSPNDIIQDRAGNYYFTDPIFGLGMDQTPDLKHRGVYKLTKDNELFLLVSDLEGPNGLGLSLDEKYLLVANTSKNKAILYEFELDNTTNSIKNRKEIYDFSNEVKNGHGVLDGLTIDSNGNIYLTGPKGLWIFNKDYKPIARLIVPNAISNCTLSKDEKSLYLTNTDKILRWKLK